LLICFRNSGSNGILAIGVEPFRNVQPVAGGNFFKRQKLWVLLNSQFAKLVKLLSDPADFSGTFLRQSVNFPELADALLSIAWQNTSELRCQLTLSSGISDCQANSWNYYCSASSACYLWKP